MSEFSQKKRVSGHYLYLFKMLTLKFTQCIKEMGEHLPTFSETDASILLLQVLECSKEQG